MTSFYVFIWYTRQLLTVNCKSCWKGKTPLSESRNDSRTLRSFGKKIDLFDNLLFVHPDSVFFVELTDLECFHFFVCLSLQVPPNFPTDSNVTISSHLEILAPVVTPIGSSTKVLGPNESSWIRVN